MVAWLRIRDVTCPNGSIMRRRIFYMNNLFQRSVWNAVVTMTDDCYGSLPHAISDCLSLATFMEKQHLGSECEGVFLRATTLPVCKGAYQLGEAPSAFVISICPGMKAGSGFSDGPTFGLDVAFLERDHPYYCAFGGTSKDSKVATR